LLEDRYHRAEEVDWDQLRRATDERLEAAPSRAGSYVAISTTLARIGDAHNRLFTPDAVQAFAGERSGELPTVERDGGVLTVTLPPVNVNHGTANEYIAHVFSAIHDESDIAACGWIVDVRGFTGGSMVLPLAALGPILAGQEAVSVAYPDGTVAKNGQRR
jgi:carboxyl-terminal processing protease